MTTARDITGLTRSAEDTAAAWQTLLADARRQESGWWSLLASARDLRSANAATFDALVETLRPRDLAPPATVISALRNAELRRDFLAEWGAFTSSQVAEVVGSSARNTAALASRWRKEGRVFAVPWGEQMLYPAFQFSDGAPHPTVAQVLKAFAGRASGWETAIWFVTPSAYLWDPERPDDPDARPVDHLDKPHLLVHAAEQAVSLPEF